MAEVAKHTDFAMELSETFATLTDTQTVGGANYLADRFGVGAWSSEFMQIVICLNERITLTEVIAQSAIEDESVRAVAIATLDQAKTAFSIHSLSVHWRDHGAKVSSDVINPLKLLSPSIRSAHSFIRLSEDAVTVLLEEADALIEHLKLHQLTDGDFLREATIDGLNLFRFRLQHFRWVGVHYIAGSLRAVSAGALGLRTIQAGRRRKPTETVEMVERITSFVKKAYIGLHAAKDFADNVDFLTKSFDAGNAVIHVAMKTVPLLTYAGPALLTHGQ
jgi:hypothetical protein